MQNTDPTEFLKRGTADYTLLGMNDVTVEHLMSICDDMNNCRCHEDVHVLELANIPLGEHTWRDCISSKILSYFLFNYSTTFYKLLEGKEGRHTCIDQEIISLLFVLLQLGYPSLIDRIATIKYSSVRTDIQSMINLVDGDPKPEHLVNAALYMYVTQKHRFSMIKSARDF